MNSMDNMMKVKLPLYPNRKAAYDATVANLHQTDDFLFDFFIYYKDHNMLTILTVISCTLSVILFSKYLKHRFVAKNGIREQKRELEGSLKAAVDEVKDLHKKLEHLEGLETQALLEERKEKGKDVRVWMDGAFDMMHYGHMNAFRQAKALGTKLIVGMNSDESITMCKGQPVTTDDERLHVINSIKWVDEVVRDVPYVMNEAYLEYVIEKYDIDYIVHGDDPCIVDGKDVYETAKKAGMYRSIPRTEGVSTTDIVGRMLLNTRNHHTTDVSNLRARSGSMGSLSNESNENSKNNNSMNNSLSSINSPKGSNQESDSHTESGGVVTESLTGSNRSSIGSLNGDGQGEKTRETGEAEIDTQISDPYNMYEEDAEAAMYKSKSSFLTTSHILRLFSAGVLPVKKGERVVYIAGDWDMFHAGHTSVLKMARELGDYLIVGVHSDKVVNALHGQNLPIMNLNERLLSVLGCKYVGDVLIDAPYNISKEMVSSLNISVVVKTDIDQFDNPGHKGGSEGSIDCHKEGKEGGSIDGGRDSGREGDREASIEGSMKGSVRGEGSMKGDTKRDKHAISDPYVIPREMGLLTEVPVSSKFKTLTVLDIVDRINMQRDKFAAKFARKKVQEDAYYTDRHNLSN